MCESELLEFDKECIEINNKQFQDFSEFEAAYCYLINKCNAIRKNVLEHPDECAPKTLAILKNQSQDISAIAPKYKCLLNIIELRNTLMQKYEIEVKKLVAQKDYDYAIRIYRNMFFFTGNYNYKKEIANLYLKSNWNFTSCFSIYKECEPHLGCYSYFWLEFSEVYKLMEDYFHQVECLQKAIKIELNEMDGKNA